MSLIAGYQAKGSKARKAEFQEKLNSFRILAEDDPSSYDNLTIETRFGCFMRKFKPEYPTQRKPYDDGNGTTLLVLGFLNLQSPILNTRQLEKLEGEFVAIQSDPSGAIHIINDRFGSRPFYILNHLDGVYFSSNLLFLLHIAGNVHEPDIVGWFQLFSCGHTFANLTTFKNVKRLPPASHVTISPEGSIQESRYWQLEYRPRYNLDLASHSKKVFEAFRTGAEYRSQLAGKGVLALSGGLDSRLVAGALPNRSHFPAFTFVDSDKDASTAETRAAAEVCKAMGLEHRIEPIPKQEYFTVATDVIRLTGGMRPLHHSATVVPYIRELKRRKLNFLLGGGPGDVSAGSKIPSVRFLSPRNAESCVREFSLALAGGSHYLELFFKPEIVNGYRKEFDQVLMKSFAEITGPTAAHRVTAWELIHRWPAFTFTSVLHNHPDVSEAFCHLDYEYSDLMLQLPADWLYQRNFYACMIYHCLPELRHVPYANTGQLLSGELRHFKNESIARRILNFGAASARKVLPKGIKRRLRAKDSPSFTYHLYKNDSQLLNDIRECLQSHSKLREILDAERCLRFIDGFVRENLEDVSFSQQTELMGSLTTMCQTFKVLTETFRS